MNEVLGVINLINERPILKELTQHRCLASVPFGARYRLIDFILSSFVRANISKVGIFSKEKYRSLMDHLGSGKEWDLDRHNGGLYILPPVDPGEQMLGDLQQFHSHIEFFQRSRQEMVIISPGHQICKMDFKKIYDFHKQNEADLTVVYKDYDGMQPEKPFYHQCTVNDEGEVSDIKLFTFPKKGDPICLETYVIRKDLLIELINDCVRNNEYDFLRDAVKANLSRLKVKGYRFEGYLPFIHSIQSFYDSSLQFLNPEVWQSFFYEEGNVFTKVKHEAPSKYSKEAKVSHSLIANGCEIEGTVENSILFRGVKVKKGAHIKNSIIMQKVDIESEAQLENVIADKQAHIGEKAVVVGKGRPKVIQKSATL
ncbi:MAG TPA: glucose-1-phosphate adenylyltransferase subunit GlgD [Bacillales bacterium]|nr:glucose-1-phosphate adenylyltransferase subunit GlgD [Bacillales bacterium]